MACRAVCAKIQCLDQLRLGNAGGSSIPGRPPPDSYWLDDSAMIKAIAREPTSTRTASPAKRAADGVVGDQTWSVSLHAASATLESAVGLNFIID